MKIRFPSLLGLALCLLCSCQSEANPQAPTEFETIRNLNTGMEDAFRQGDMLNVSSFYGDSCDMLAPGGYRVSGREEIDAYWQKVPNPIDWKLTVVSLHKKEAEAFDHPFWKQMKKTPPLWGDFDITLSGTEDLIYELGHSELITLRPDSSQHSSHVDFLLVWAPSTDGSYEIIIDTYAANGPLPPAFMGH